FGSGAMRLKADSVWPLYGCIADSTRIRYIAKERDRTEFITFVLPCEQGSTPPEVLDIPIETGHMFVVQYGDYRDVLLFGEGGARIRNENISSDFAMTWARTHLKDDLPEQVVAIDGARLSIVTSPIIREDASVRYVSARRFGKEMYVNADGERQTVRLTDLPS